MNGRSQELLAIARRFTERLPMEAGAEVAVSGSVSKGWADAGSDIELNVWGSGELDIETRRRWLVNAGAQEIVLDDRWKEPDGSLWGVFQSEGESFEVGWQSVTACEELVGKLVRGEITRYEDMVIGDVLMRCIALRSEGVIGRWKAMLANYPAELVPRVVDAAVADWTVQHWVDLRWWFARRGQQLMLRHFLREDIDKALNIVCAVNRRWPPVWKWNREEVGLLEIAPADFGGRSEAVFAEPDPERATEMAYRLALAALAMAPDTEQSVRAAECLRRSLGWAGRGA